MEEACNYSKTKMEHLSCGAFTHDLACWRPCPFWRKRVVRRYLLLRKMYRVIGTLYILAPLLRKSRHTNLSNRNLPFWRPFKFWRPYAEKARITQHFGAHALRFLCVPGGRQQYHWRRRPIANNRKTLPITMWVAGCKPTGGAKRVENDVKAIFNNWCHSHPNAPKSVDGWGSAPDPPIAKESAFGPCQSDTPS